MPGHAPGVNVFFLGCAMRKEISGAGNAVKTQPQVKNGEAIRGAKVANDVPGTKKGFHPRNRHRTGYDFKQLMKSCSALVPFVSTNVHGVESINFADPEAVKALNKALLKYFYRVSKWEIPAGYLCPPVPGRVDYIHYIADLLASCNGGTVPSGKSVHILDIGVGASCIYPIIGRSEYDWRFLGTESDPVALASAKRIVQSNRGLDPDVQLRLQPLSSNIFRGIMPDGIKIDAVICNPPFHASPDEAAESTRRKWRNLGKESITRSKDGRTPVLNFGGQVMELCCDGGERGFVRRMIEESRLIPSKCLWFTALISKESNLAGLYHVLRKTGVTEFRTIEMAQGQKRSRLLAWTFLGIKERQDWFVKDQRGQTGQIAGANRV